MIGRIFGKRNLETSKKIVASIMMPIFVLQMCSLNLLLINVAHAEEAVVGQTSVLVAAPVVEEKAPEPADAPASEKVEAPAPAAVEQANPVLAPTVPAIDPEEASIEVSPKAAVAAVESKPIWPTSGNKATTNDAVELNKTYTAPQNDQVSVRFTKLPDEPGTLSIEEITLTDEQVSSLGALSNKAYDITSTMENGTFEYDLTLPKPENKSNVQIKYAEDVVGLENADVVPTGDITIKSDEVNTSLNHFTTFVVVGTISGNTATAFDESGANILINEFLYNPSSGNEWVELYNKTNESIILTGWKLCELNGGEGSENCHALSATSIPSKGFVVQELSNDLNNSKDTIILKNNGGAVIDKVTFNESNPTIVNAQNLNGEPDGTQSIARTEDGGSVWKITTPTKGQSNNSASVIPTCNGSSFDNFNLGSVNNQDGWSVTGPYDQAIVDNTFGYSSFGCKSLRLSDSKTSGSFGDQVFAKLLSNGAGELSATAGTFSVGTRQNHFETQFDIASVLSTRQSGMHVSISPDRGDGSRMSYLRLEDGSEGVDVYFDDVQGTSNPANFVETKIATGLNRAVPQTIKISMDFVDGSSNDIVKVYIDSQLVHTGTSWENYYRYDSEAAAEQSPRIVKTVLFRESGDANSGNAGKGFLFDNISLNSSIISQTLPADTEAPAVPTLISPTDGVYRHTSDANFSDWSDVTDPSGVGYRYQSASDAEFNHLYYDSNNYGPLLTESKIMNPGEPEVSYFWRVQACDLVGNCSAWSAPRKINIDNKAPTVPTSGTPNDKSIATNNFDFDWDASADNSPITYEFQSSLNPAQSGGVLTSGLWHSGILPSNKIHSSGAPDGTWFWQVRAIDAAGNQSAWSEIWDVTLNTSIPAVPTGIYFKDTVNNKNVQCGEFTSARNFDAYWNANTEADFDHYEYISFNADGSTGPIRTFTTPYFNASWWTVPTEGTYGVQIRAVDTAGNKSAWSGGVQGVNNSCKYTADWTTPTTPVITGFKNPTLSCGAITNLKNITVDWSDSSEANLAGYNYNIDYPLASGSGRGIWDAFFTASQYGGSLNEGIHHIKVQAKDKAGNVSDWSNVCDITYDSIVPTATISYDKTTLTNGNVIATLNPSEPVTVTSVGGNTHTFTVNGTFMFEFKDAAGNTGTAIATVDNIDKIAPVVSITAPAAGFIVGTVDIRGTVVEEHPDHYWLAIYKKSNNQLIYSIIVNHTDQFENQSLYLWDTTKVDDGEYQIKFAERDLDYNTGNRSSDFVMDVTVDNTKPTSTIVGGDNNGIIYYNNWNGIVTGTASDALSGVKGVKISVQRTSDNKYWNGKAWQMDEITNDAVGTTTWSYNINTVLTEDVYTIKSHAVDEMGNQENTYTLTIVFDKTIPEVGLTIDPASPNGDNGWYDSKPVITLTASDNNEGIDKIEYQFDSQVGAWTTYSGPVEINNGQHVFYYRSLDLAGNYSNVGAKNVKVDTEAPPTVKNVDAQYDRDENAVKLNWDANDDDIYKVYIYKGDNKHFALNAGSRLAKNDNGNEDITDNNVEVGKKYYYKFVSVDEAGNKSDVKIVSIKIAEDGGGAIVADEGTESAPQGAVSGADTDSNQNQNQNQNQAGQSIGMDEGQSGNGQVEGASTSKNNPDQSHRSWWYVLVAIGIILLGTWYYRKRKRMMPKID